MQILISPAKKLDFTPLVKGTLRELPLSKPLLHTAANRLVTQLQSLTAADFSRLMKISENLSATTHTYFLQWKKKFDSTRAKPALLAFQGDVYQGFNADTLTKADLMYANQHLNILSGLYGLLRPFDLIQPYRLEMGTKFENDRGKNLYQYWDSRVTKLISDRINASSKTSASKILVNLASNEYYKVVQPKQLTATLVTPAFRDLKNENYKVISFFAKRARGLMARYLIENRVTTLKEITKFKAAGYHYNRKLSSELQPVFTRDTPQ